MKSTVTIKTIAKILGISPSTVSRALQGNPRIGLRTREKVLEKAEELKYVSNSAAQMLKNKATHTIGIIVPNLQEEYFALMIKGIEDVLYPLGIQCIIAQSRDEFERESNAVQHFLKSRVDAVILSLAAETNHFDHFSTLQKYRIPIIFCDRTPKGFPSHRVVSRIEEGLKDGMSLVSARGITKIALLNGPANLLSSDSRLNTYLDGIQRLNLNTSPSYVKSTDLSKKDTREKMHELLQLSNRPEVIITFNDYVAFDAIQATQEYGLKPNEDILFLSFANLPISNYVENPPFASVEQFPYKIGEAAAQLYTRIAENPDLSYQEIHIESKLMFRKKPKNQPNKA